MFNNPTPAFTNKDYLHFLETIKSRIQSARISAARSVNRELISLYWEIGKGIVAKQKTLGWGKSVVEQLSKDIQKEYDGISGFSADNLWRMRQLYEEYTRPEILEQAVPEMTRKDPEEFLLQLVREIPPIGIILCAQRNRLEVEYSLRSINKPVGVAEYQLTKQLPPDLKDKLPSAEEIQNELLNNMSGEK